MQQIWGSGFFKGGQTIRSLLMAPKDKDPITNKVESYIHINAVNMGVMKNTLENLPEILQKGSRNIRRPLPIYLTTVTPQVTISTSTILP